MAEQRSFPGAARLLHLTQPVLARRMRELEETLGVRLFVHEGDSVRLTHAGQVFLKEAQALLAQAERATALTRHAAEEHTAEQKDAPASNGFPAADEPAMVDLVGVGLNATDTVIPLPHHPAPGSKVEYHAASVHPGGQTATTVVACQHWGMRTRYVGKLGDDSAAALHREAFARAGVDAQLITVEGAASPQSIILVDGEGERSVLCQRDERLTLQPDELDRAWIQRARALHIDGFDTAAAALAAGWAREAGIPVIADLDELYPGVDELLTKIDYLIVSRDFPCRLMQENDLETALRGMQRRYGNTLTAATLGHDGVLAWDGRQMHYVPAFHVPVADTTGAGDIFHAGFIYGLLQAWPLERTLEFACAAAALNCMAAGARGGIQTVEAVEKLMASGARYHSAFCVADESWTR
ncbi:LysR family transcriptional regulator [Acidipila sp. 4G-K13]|nr:LysR family transcriptional regulator [Paracidobacterium acidisoli]